MIAFDTTFLVDYLEGDPATKAFLEDRNHEPFYNPSIALFETELLADGTPINLRDVLIAGICRHNGACLVSRASHFEHVGGLETVAY